MHSLSMPHVFRNKLLFTVQLRHLLLSSMRDPSVKRSTCPGWYGFTSRMSSTRTAAHITAVRSSGERCLRHILLACCCSLGPMVIYGGEGCQFVEIQLTNPALDRKSVV